MRDKQNSINLSGFFLKEGEDHKEAREQIAKAWRHIHKKSKKDMGPRGGFFGTISLVGPSESYSVEDAVFPGNTDS